MKKLWDMKFWEGYYSASPIPSQIRVRPQREGKSGSFQDEEGTIRRVEYKKASITIHRKLKDARGMTPEEFANTASEPARRIGTEIVHGIYEKLDEVTKETGNRVAGPLTQDLFLELLGKIQFDFALDGTPIWPSLNLGAEAHVKFQRLWPDWMKDSAFLDRMNELLERKRQEFYEREACRRLAD